MGQHKQSGGYVFLVGAGPGHADLITVRGLHLLRAADVVVYDRLIDPALLEEVRPDAERIYAGKAPGRHTLSQHEIIQKLVCRARRGYQVVRLKGGDPFVFGRGGEEALALRLAGIRYEIVPGVSSAIAAPAYAGVPVTQRGIASSFAVVTGHEKPDHGDSDTDGEATDWEALSHIPTLVILMGMHDLRANVRRLLTAGKDPTTPAVVIHQCATTSQETVAAELGSLADAVEARGIGNPAVIVIGEVARLHGLLDWYVNPEPTTSRCALVPLPAAAAPVPAL